MKRALHCIIGNCLPEDNSNWCNNHWDHCLLLNLQPLLFSNCLFISSWRSVYAPVPHFHSGPINKAKLKNGLPASTWRIIFVESLPTMNTWAIKKRNNKIERNHSMRPPTRYKQPRISKLTCYGLLVIYFQMLGRCSIFSTFGMVAMDWLEPRRLAICLDVLVWIPR